MQLQPSIKDRNGADIVVGDWVRFLEGSAAGDNYYETGGAVVQINPRTRVVKIDNGGVKFWYEIWKEEG